MINNEFSESRLKLIAKTFLSFLLLYIYYNLGVITNKLNEQHSVVKPDLNIHQKCNDELEDYDEVDSLVILYRMRSARSSFYFYSAYLYSATLSPDSSLFIISNNDGIVTFMVTRYLELYDTVVINTTEFGDGLGLVKNDQTISQDYYKLRGPYFDKEKKGDCNFVPMRPYSHFCIEKMTKDWRYKAIIEYRRNKLIGKNSFFPIQAYWLEGLLILIGLFLWRPSEIRKIMDDK